MRSFLDLSGGFFWYKIGINRFCVDLSKYWANKEKDHNILWSEWYSRRVSAETPEGGPSAERRFARANHGTLAGRKDQKNRHHKRCLFFWYSRRESNPQRPLRRGLLYPFNYGSVLRCKFPPPGGYQPKPLKGSPRLSVASLARTTAAFQRGLLYPFNYGSV